MFRHPGVEEHLLVVAAKWRRADKQAPPVGRRRSHFIIGGKRMLAYPFRKGVLSARFICCESAIPLELSAIYLVTAPFVCWSTSVPPSLSSTHHRVARCRSFLQFLSLIFRLAVAAVLRRVPTLILSCSPSFEPNLLPTTSHGSALTTDEDPESAIRIFISTKRCVDPVSQPTLTCICLNYFLSDLLET
jgi:hypothetical protein